MEACTHGVNIIGRLTHLSLIVQVFVSYLQLRKFMVCLQEVLTLSLHFRKLIWRFQFIWNCRLVLMLQIMKVGNSMFYIRIKAFMDLSRLVTIGSQNSAMVFKIGDLSRAVLILAYFLGTECIVLTYVDDCIIVAKSMLRIDDLIKSLHGGDENLFFKMKVLSINISESTSSN
jgi:hypothetical protein